MRQWRHSPGAAILGGVGRGGRTANEQRVLRVLFEREAGEHDATEIVDRCGLDADVVYRTLARLEREVLVISDGRRGHPRRWRLTVAGISSVLRTLSDLELITS
jgi:DNA-binding IclR family transcriptional regulator